MKTEKVSDKIWKFTGFDSVNAYFLDMDKKIFIDCGNHFDHKKLEKAVAEVVNPAKIELVLFTHLHYDHAGNFGLFKNAEFYASEKEIIDFKKCAPFYPDKSLLSKLKPLPSMIAGIQVIHTPGHTHGSVCFFLEKEKILFTGDTFFGEGMYGRTDLANSEPDKMKSSIMMVKGMRCEIICPGHDY